MTAPDPRPALAAMLAEKLAPAAAALAEAYAQDMSAAPLPEDDRACRPPVVTPDARRAIRGLMQPGSSRARPRTGAGAPSGATDKGHPAAAARRRKGRGMNGALCPDRLQGMSPAHGEHDIA